MKRSSKFSPGTNPGDRRFRCVACGREYWLAFGVSAKKQTSHRTRIGGRDWCDACASKRFKRSRRLFAPDERDMTRIVGRNTNA